MDKLIFLGAMLSFLGYLALTVCLLQRRFVANRFIYGGSLLTLLLHMGVLYAWIDTPLGHNLNAVNIVSLSLWLSCVVLMGVSVFRPIYHLAGLLFPLSALSIVFGMARWHAPNVLTAMNTWQVLHIWVSGLTLALLLLCCVQAFILTVHDIALKRKWQFALGWQATPMLTMESILLGLMLLTWFTLTGLIISSVVLSVGQYTLAIYLKLSLSVLTWLSLFGLMAGYYYHAWRGRKIYYMILFINAAWLSAYAVIQVLSA